MAFDNTGGSWLQPDEELLNPYFGATMLHCGEVRGQLAEAKSVALDDKGSQALNAVVADYLALQSALAADSLETAQSAARALASSAGELPSQAESNPDAAFQLETLGGKLAGKAEAAGGVDNLAQLRANFQTLSALIESLVTAFGGGLDSPLFKAHCPMAFKNAGGDWLQADEELLNPYFGASMLHCGEIVAQLVGPEAPADGNPDDAPSEAQQPDSE